MEEKAITLFKKWCPPGLKATVINLAGKRFRVERDGRRITVEPLGRES